ncbi:MAG: Chaperone protein Skp precursor [Alphaproteobacteria bacterium ADurb.BinA280]|jgi:outer membrane protein|nr:OmpH family outer membrane protein [Xanthomonadales bacterium]MCC6504459.1 OmpH family outer membrane protein [Aquimonas sp.]OPZ12290.1 MAG: Chaperone protein Skp precursor [Alphaproteobacteria bacterium ADurb.BinA280]
MPFEKRSRRRPTQDLLRLALAGALLFCAPIVLAQAAKIGYVDMQRLIDSAPHVRDARLRLQREFATRDDLLSQDRSRLAQLQQRLDTLPADSPETNGETLQAEINALKRSITRTSERLRSELESRSSEEVERAWPQINEAVIDYANEQGFDLILPGPVVFANDRVDVTEQVLERLQATAEDSQQP